MRETDLRVERSIFSPCLEFLLTWYFDGVILDHNQYQLASVNMLLVFDSRVLLDTQGLLDLI